MVRYGLAFSTSHWLWQSRELVNPFVVGRYAGAEAVGYVALALRILAQLSFIQDAAFRLSIATLARFQGNSPRLVRAVTEGISLQLMVLGPILAGFGLVAPWVIPLLFGSEWLPVLEIYPFLAVGLMAFGMFTLLSTALYVIHRNLEVGTFHAVYVTLFAGSAFLLVPYVGIVGYGWAEIAALTSYSVLLIYFARYIGRLGLSQAGVWFVAWAIPLFSWQLGPWAWVSVLLPLIWSATRKELLGAVAMVLDGIRKAR